MKYSLCIETVFKDVDFYERILLAKELGLDGVEFWGAEGKDADKVANAAGKAGIPVVGCTLIGAWQAPFNAEWSKIKPNILKTVAFGKEAGCNKFIGLSGNVKCKTDAQKSVIIENLKRAAEICEKEDVHIALEALNTVNDHLGYYLDSSYVGFEIIKAVDNSRIKLLYDIYHMQLMEGNIVQNLVENVNSIGHIHSAGVPGRHELHVGELNYPFIIDKLEEAGYMHYFGLEYIPTYENKQSVADILSYLKRQ